MNSSRRTRVLSGIVPCLSAVLLVTPATAVTAGSHWQFGVLLDDKRIGYHSFHVTREGDRQVLESEAEFDVKFLFITAFRYRHRNVESWKNGCLSSIDASTNNNGAKLEVKGRREAGRFEVIGNAGSSTLPECVQTFAYWNPEILQADRLLNSQTGEYEDVSVVFESNDAVSIGGRTVDALRYRLSAKAGDIRLWYSRAGRRWLALEAPAKGGRTIRYQPLAVPDGAASDAQIARAN